MGTAAISVRLLSVSVLLPAVAIALDAFLLDRATQLGWSTSATLAAFVLLWAQTALLSWSAGRWLPNWPWRLLVLGWSTVVVNLLLYSVAIVGRSGWQNMALLLAISFLASQAGAATVWAVLGSQRWQQRWRLAAVAIAPAAWVAWRLNDAFPWAANTWMIVALVQTVGAGLIATLLRILGYCIEQANATAPAEQKRAPVQFSLQQMLVWTTCVAVLVFSLQLLIPIASQDKAWPEWIQIGIEGIVLALLALIAAWAALGAGPAWLRMPLAIGLAAGTAWVLEFLEARYQAGRPARGYYYWMPSAEWLWYVWTTLAGAFLAGLLLVFRATGYRLVRSRRTAT